MNKYFLDGKLAWMKGEYSLIKESSGELGVLELGKEFSFPVKRVFFLRKIDSLSSRGFHSHEELKQILVCLSGSLTMKIDDGKNKYDMKLGERNSFLYLDGMIWREMYDFSEDAVLMVLCDREYKNDMVVRDYKVFLKNIKDRI